ncbi:MAG: hypothetical protein ACOYN0_12790 [Phycisphaerales bacterium]
MDRNKRRKLIADYLKLVEAEAGPLLLTPEDKLLLERARELDPDPVPPAMNAEGDLVIDHDPLCALYEKLRGVSSDALFGILMNDAIKDRGKLSEMRPARALEVVFRRERAGERTASFTLAAAAFFDGNDCVQSIAPNRQTIDRASFDVIKAALLDVASHETVVAVGVELDDVPDPDSEADAEEWPTAGRVFVWTTERLSVVKKWLAALKPDGVSKVALRSVYPPPGVVIPKKVAVYAAGWD